MPAARGSLAFLWIFTGLASVLFQPQFGYDLLAQAGITGLAAGLCVWGGAILDILLGLWLLTPWRRPLCYRVQILTVPIYTVLLTPIAPAYWLHPFGPVTKNLPILVLTAMLAVQDKPALGR